MKVFLTIAALQLSLVFGSLVPALTSFTFQTARGGFKTREANVHAPELYADNLEFTATLVNLPGAQKQGSTWELSWQLFFIPEEKYYAALKSFPRGASNPTAEQFPGRILLAEGHKKKTRLGTLKDRTFTLAGVPFKQKIPDAQRTKFALLLTSYSVKIFDAELNTTVYRSGIFLTEPFAASSGDQVTARKTIYLNFGVNPDGTLNRSQSARNNTDITWK